MLNFIHERVGFYSRSILNAFKKRSERIQNAFMKRFLCESQSVCFCVVPTKIFENSWRNLNY